MTLSVVQSEFELLFDLPKSVYHQNMFRFLSVETNRKLVNWVGKSSDFTNPFVCGPAGGKVKKMSAASASVSHILSK